MASICSSGTPSAMPLPDPADPIAALTAALAKLLPNQPSISLVTPSFDWNTTVQYDDFQLFCKSVGELVHPAKHSSGDTRGSHCGTQPHSPGVRAQFPGQHWPQESSTVGSQLAQLMRLRGRRSELQPSWTTCHQQWTMQYRNAAESTNWKMFASDLESHQMNSLTVSRLLLIDAIYQQKMKRNGTSSTDLLEP